MKAAKVLFWKEIGENAKWAAMGALALAIGLAYAVSHAVNGNDEPDMLSLVWNGVNMTLALGACIIGVALGCLQILPEQSHDRWAFFMHRPASRLALFAGKAAAGIVLLLTSTLIPLIGIAIWMQTPGNIAGPFDWGMTESGFAFVAVGIVFYFAGQLAAVRPARGYGSRLMPIPAAILCAVVALDVAYEFWQALLVAGCFAFVLGFAAWDGFRIATGDQIGKLSGRFSLGLMLATGIAMTAVAIAAVLVGAWQAALPSRSESHGLAWTSEARTTEDGQVVRERKLVGLGGVVSDVVGIGDVNYNPLSVGDPQQWVASHPLFDMHDIDTRLRPVSERWPRYSETSRYATLVDSYNYGVSPYDNGEADGPGIRYLFHGLIMRYSERSRTLVGAIGTKGYREAHTVDEAMQAESIVVNRNVIVDYPDIIAGQNAIYAVGGRSLSPMLTTPDAGQARNVSLVQVNVDDTPMTLIVIATSAAFHIIFPRSPTVTLPRHYGPSLYNSVSLAVTGGGRFVLCYQHGAGGARASASSYVEVYDNGGNRLSGYSVAAESAQSWASMSPNQSPQQLHAILYGLVVPIAYAAPFALDMVVQSDVRSVRQYMLLIGAISGIIPFLIGTVIAGILAALVTWRIARNGAFGRGVTMAWVVGNLFLSWIGVLVMIALRPIRVRERCESCGKSRVVTGDVCEHCGASWPDVKRDGTEIFDEPSEAVRLAV